MNPLPIDVVSVQSQVVYGRVGNNAAVPALEALGLSVVAVPTVVFSNTPHYPSMHGGALPIEWFEGYLQDLSARGALSSLRAVLTGYLGGPVQAVALAHWLSSMSTERAGVRVFIDPVLGDRDHGMYVSAHMVRAYREHLLPLAHGLTPNGFELECLTGLPVNDIPNVVAAARSLLVGRTEWVAVTSAAPDAWLPDEMHVVIVTRTHVHVLTHPCMSIVPKGTGDLFCAVLTGQWLGGTPLPEAAAKACQHVLRVLRHTEQARCAELLPLSPDTDSNQFPLDLVRVRQFSFNSHRNLECHTPTPI